jgi:hypothetical protein
MSTQWITDRLPTKEDGTGFYVWVTNADGYVDSCYWGEVAKGMPWQPITKPAPYVKPKRWKVRWHNELGLWMLTDNDFTQMHLPLLKLGDVDVAWQIANIYNEAMP